MELLVEKNTSHARNEQQICYFFGWIWCQLISISIYINLKFGDGDGPNLCRVKKVDVSSTFIENIFRSGLTLVSSNDISNKLK